MKKTPNQIREELRRQMAKNYNNDLENLRGLLKKQQLISNDYWQRYQRAKSENDELKEKVKQFEDWNNRLMEFMNMSDEDRVAYVENLKKTKELNDIIKRFRFYGDLLGKLFI